MPFTKRIILLLGLLIVAFSTIVAQDDLPDPMRPYRMVNDFSKIYTSSQVDSLEQKLRNFHDLTTTQIYVVTVNTLNGDAAYNYAARLGNKWGIGQKGKDNGVLILIKPKNEEGRGSVFIAPGYGLESILPDGYVGRIIDTYMIPNLKRNDYYSATDQAIDALKARISGDESTEFLQPKAEENSAMSNILPCILIPLFIILMIVFPQFRTFIFLILTMMSRGGGGGGRGGRGGGGFGGGGGGSFGGGGAGRSW